MASPARPTATPGGNPPADDQRSNPAPARILCVDDEPRVLSGLRRNLVELFDVHTATSGMDGLELLESAGPFAVVVSDMRMPNMDGAEFLKQARQRWPDTVRVLLTGHAELTAAIAAVNDGNIFRFLCKPCPEAILLGALNDAVEQHRLIHAERELLEGTLSGALGVLADMLGLVAPGAFTRAQRIKCYVEHMVSALGVGQQWLYDAAALLAPLGCITLPPETLQRSIAGQPLSTEEQAMLDAFPATGHRLLSGIPRLEPVAQIVARQRERIPKVDLDDPIQVGVAMVGLGIDIEDRRSRGATFEAALVEVRRQRTHDPMLVETLRGYRDTAPEYAVKAVRVRDLDLTMVLDQDVRTDAGMLVVPQGRQVDLTLLERLRNFGRTSGIKEPIRVRCRSGEAAPSS